MLPDSILLKPYNELQRKNVATWHLQQHEENRKEHFLYHRKHSQGNPNNGQIGLVVAEVFAERYKHTNWWRP